MRVLIFFLGGWLSLISLNAQQIPFRNYTTKDGLAQINVRTVFQDSKGFMWFGTWNGVNRYDGAEFRHFTVRDGLPHYLISHITEDRKGNIWVATNFSGISKFNGETFVNHAVDPDIPGAPENRVKFIFEQDDTTFLIGTDRGLFIFDGENFTLQEFGIEIRPVAILKDDRGWLWSASDPGLCVLVSDTSSKCITASDLTNKWVTCLVEDTDRNVWIGTEHGLRRTRNINAEMETFVTEPPPTSLQFLTDKWIRSLFVDHDGFIWIGTGGYGLFKVSPQGQVARYTTTNGLAGDHILSIYQDREMCLWFATTTGVSKLVSKQLTNYTVFDGLPDQLVQDILEDNDGNIWVGTRLGIYLLRQKSMDILTTEDGLLSNYVLDLFKDADGTIWVGTEGGVNKVRSAGAEITIDAFGEEHGWQKYRKRWENRGRITYRDLYGNLWFGNDIGIALLKDNQFRQYSVIDYEDRDLVVAIVMDNAGYLWIGRFNSGISRYVLQYDENRNINLTETARYDVKNGLKTDRIQSVYKDQDGNLWFSTRHEGIYKFNIDNNGAVTNIINYTTSDGLSYDLVHNVFQDSRGQIWVGGGAGVDQIELDGDGIKIIRRITMNEGLAGEIVIEITEDSHGNIWFATSGGATRYDPNFVPFKSTPPPIYITDFKVFGETDSAALKMLRAILPHNQHSISFEFIGIGFKDERSLRYRYMLEGFDRDWSEPTSRRYMNYTHLPPGKYTFKVITKNGDGVWSESPATFLLHIGAPFWRSWWFVLGSFFTIIGIVFLIHNYRLERAIEIERMRSRIATDLHDDIGSTLSGISIFSEMGTKQTEDKIPKAAELFQRIGESSLSMLDAMDDIIWAINPENDSLDTLVERIRNFSTELLEAKNITFTLNLPSNSQNIKLSMNERKNFYLIFKEGLHNLVRHSRCYSALIEMTTENSTMTLRIIDDGIGMDLTNNRNGNGIKNMRKRADAMGATLLIESQINKGTKICLQLKIT